MESYRRSHCAARVSRAGLPACGDREHVATLYLPATPLHSSTCELDRLRVCPMIYRSCIPVIEFMISCRTGV